MTILLVSKCFSWAMGTTARGARQYAETGGVAEGQSSVCVCLSQRKYPFLSLKRKTIIFIVGRKKNNNTASMQEIAGVIGRKSRRKVTCEKSSLPRSGRGVNALRQ